MIKELKKKKIKKFQPKFPNLKNKKILSQRKSYISKFKNNQVKDYQKIGNFNISKPENSQNYININKEVQVIEKLKDKPKNQNTQEQLLQLNDKDIQQLKQQLNPEDYVTFNRSQIAKKKYGW